MEDVTDDQIRGKLYDCYYNLFREMYDDTYVVIGDVVDGFVAKRGGWDTLISLARAEYNHGLQIDRLVTMIEKFHRAGHKSSGLQP